MSDLEYARAFYLGRFVAVMACLVLASSCDSGGSALTAPDGYYGADGQQDIAADASGDSDANPDLDVGADGQTQADIKPTGDANGADADAIGPVYCLVGEPCDDLDPCTMDDACEDGVCVGASYSCEDDGLDCTLIQCDGMGGCTYPVRGDACLIEGTCYEDGDAHPEIACMACVSPVSQQEWSADDTLKCDDGDACTSDEYCDFGECVGGWATPCDDGNACTHDTCTPEGGCEHEATDVPCSDGDPCTLGDHCDNGGCVAGEGALTCGDGNGCTDDSCEPGVGCQFAPNSNDCDDGNACTVGDGCVGGSCEPGAAPLACNDGNPCTDDDCDALTGCFVSANTAACDDGSACTVGDTCGGGGCLPGLTPLLCDDGNPCTDDLCEPAVGCVHVANTLPCDDANACTVGDICGGGVCTPGATPLACDDQDVCTDDGCDPATGCTTTFNSAPCTDYQPCTLDDVCSEGDCVGTPKVCNDGNACTLDACVPSTGTCTHAPIDDSFECIPIITINTPARAASLTGSTSVVVQGHVASGGGPIVAFSINGVSVPVGADGGFTTTVAASHGMNLIDAVATDAIGNHASTVQSFYYSTKYTPVNPANPKSSSVFDGILLRLGQSVIDDGVHNPNDVDDLATVVELLAASFNIQGLIPNPIGNVSGVKIELKSLTYGAIVVALNPINGGLHVKLTVPNLNAGLKFTYEVCAIWCFDVTASGTAKATKVLLDTDLFVSVSPTTGAIQVTAGSTSATVSGLNVTLDGVIGFLTNWIIDFFEDDFADSLESAFESQIGGTLPGIMASALGSLALNQNFDFPPLVDGASAVSLALSSALSSSQFTTSDGRLGLRASVVTAKNQPIPSPGTLRRNGCGSGNEAAPSLSSQFPLQIGLHDDVLNQILYGLWFGGGLRFPVGAGVLGGVALPPGVSDLVLDVDFLLPPIIQNCNPAAASKLQIGDVRIDASMKLGPIPVDLVIFASLQAGVQFVASGPAGGKELGIEVIGVEGADVDLVYDDEALLALDPALRGLIETQLVPQLLDGLTGGALSGFPIPAIDLSFINGVPANTKLAIDLQGAVRSQGYTVLRGGVK